MTQDFSTFLYFKHTVLCFMLGIILNFCHKDSCKKSFILRATWATKYPPAGQFRPAGQGLGAHDLNENDFCRYLSI